MNKIKYETRGHTLITGCPYGIESIIGAATAPVGGYTCMRECEYHLEIDKDNNIVYCKHEPIEDIW